MTIPNCFTDQEAVEILRNLCEKHNVDEQLLRDLCDVTENYEGSGRRHGITNDVQECIDAFRSRSTQEESNDSVSG